MRHLLALFMLLLVALPAAAQASEGAACEAKASERKLAGASKDSFVKKCVEEAKAATKSTAKPPPRGSADASECQRSTSPVGCPPAPPKK